MTDLVTRLRTWVHAVDAVPVSDLMDEAAGEIDRLRSRPCPYVTGTVTRYCTLTPFTLTDAEREAVEVCAHAAENCNGFGGDPTRPAIYGGRQVAATLRGLLERLA